jgi:hypothetical protein
MTTPNAPEVDGWHVSPRAAGDIPTSLEVLLTLSNNFRRFIEVKLFCLDVPYGIVLLLFVSEVEEDQHTDNQEDDPKNYQEEPLTFEARTARLICVSGAYLTQTRKIKSERLHGR